jgi:ectoine hydroxylase-related dioxygenase (phytanoyl-CoA dioxygenase family)
MTSTHEILEIYRSQGFAILPDVLGGHEIDALRKGLQPYLDLPFRGRNDFEGERTQRVYSLVGRGEVFERSAEAPIVLDCLDALLSPGYLLTASQAICIGPGESPQPIHFDDTFYTLPRPRPAVSVSTIWALDDFTAENGGTEVIPGSHLWSDDEVAGTYLTLAPQKSAAQKNAPQQNDPVKSDPAKDDPANRSGANRDAARRDDLLDRLVPVEMSAGSLVLFSGTLLHRGGANRSSAPRRAFSHQYCEPWARQQENFMLSIPTDRIRKMSPRLRQLIGYSIHPPFMGQLAGRHPEKSLAEDYVNSLDADDAEIASRRE